MSKTTPIWLTILGYAGLLSLVLICLQVLQHSYVAFDLSLEMYIGLAGIIFLCIGIWLGRKFWHAQFRPKTNHEPLSRREIQVLSAASSGMSNQEIAESLFISVSTVKTHLSRIYSKLSVKRRTQAIDHAKQLQIID